MMICLVDSLLLNVFEEKTTKKYRKSYETYIRENPWSTTNFYAKEVVCIKNG